MLFQKIFPEHFSPLNVFWAMLKMNKFAAFIFFHGLHSCSNILILI